jgi:hypothetical protein
MISTELSEETRQRFELQNIRSVLQDLSQRANALSNTEDRQAFDRELRAVDQDIDSLVGNQDIFQDMSREQRRLVRQLHLEFKETVAQLYNARTQNLSTSEYATLLSSASSHITKSGLQKKLQQRVLANMNNTDHITAKERGSQLQFGDLVEDAECMLTLQNYQELAKNGDCLCLCLVVSRSQAAIADPSQVRIHKIQPTMLSLDAFRDAVDMKLIDGNDGSFHGGFQHSLGKSATILQGMAREKINAIFPLYFDDESWSITRLRMKEAFSWMATITWNGWSFSQVEVLPSMVLAQALRDHHTNPTELTKKMVERIRRTCEAISTFRIDDGTLADRHKLMLANFIESPIHRTISAVPSLPALVGIAYTYPPINDRFFDYLWEEHFRRELRWQLSDVNEVDIMRMIANKLHIDLSTYTKITVNPGSGGVEGAKIRAELNAHETPTGAATTANLTSAKWNWDPNTILPGDIQQAQQTWVYVNGWSSESRDFMSNDIYMATALQNMLHASNSARREALEKAEYICPFYNPNSLIRGIGKQVIEYFRKLEWDRYNESQNRDAAADFAATNDLFQAAGLIKSKIDHFGHHNFHRFAMSLTNPASRVVDKIRMLLTGTFSYKGKTIKLVDGWNGFGGPKRQWIHRWWLANGRNLQGVEAEEWNELLPTYKIGGWWDTEWKNQL